MLLQRDDKSHPHVHESHVNKTVSKLQVSYSLFFPARVGDNVMAHFPFSSLGLIN